jgi:REP element-mobilizing transposase RayT
MRNPLKRYYGRGDLRFVTFSCYRRRPLLGTARARDCFVKILDHVRSKRKFLLLGFIVMPEHVHLLVSEPAGSNPSVAPAGAKAAGFEERSPYLRVLERLS